MSSNYTIKSSISESLLTPSQVEFIKKVHKRYFRTDALKKDLFFIWDMIPDNVKIDGRVFKTMKHFEDIKKRVLECGSFTEYKASVGDDRIKLVRANFCKKDKLCMACAVGRAYNQQKKFIQALEVFPYEYDEDLLSKYWYYIVTPVKHSIEESLDVVYNKIDRLRKSALMQMRNSRRRNTGGFWSQFKGGMGSIEVTYTDNGWNVHINWLVYSDNRVQYKEKVDEKGKKRYENDDLERFLRRFDGSHIHFIGELDFSSREAIRKNLLEVLKYSLKFSSLDPAKLIEVYYKFYRKRLFFTFGTLRGLDLESVDDVSLGDDIEDTEEFLRIIYQKVKNSYELKYISGAGLGLSND
jgi:hypothetical protein